MTKFVTPVPNFVRSPAFNNETTYVLKIHKLMYKQTFKNFTVNFAFMVYSLHYQTTEKIIPSAKRGWGKTKLIN
jgi:hypothetical protein